jgi:DNA-binding NtrC family response regulator
VETILVTDDDSACRDTIQKALEREGYQVEGAVGVDDAVRAINRRRFDLIVCDYRMAGKPDWTYSLNSRSEGRAFPC